MTTPRYLLCPGPVTSRNDRDHHHLTATSLAWLYGVPMAVCTVLPPVTSDPIVTRHRQRLLADASSGRLIELGPRFDGNYTLPTP
jgi:hypothetical protein